MAEDTGVCHGDAIEGGKDHGHRVSGDRNVGGARRRGNGVYAWRNDG